MKFNATSVLRVWANSLVGTIAIASAASAMGATPFFSLAIGPSSPIAFDSVVARVSVLDGCWVDENDLLVKQSDNAIRIDVHYWDICIPTGTARTFDIFLGKLPPGNYSVAVYESNNIAAASAQFAVAEKYGANPPPHPLMDYTDHWWNPQESGWGMSIMQHSSDRLFAVWYVYDQNRQPTWYTLQPGSWLASNLYNGPVYKTTGPYFGGTFDPAAVGISQVGTATLKFSDPATGEFTYTIEGVSGKKAISRMPF